MNLKRSKIGYKLWLQMSLIFLMLFIALFWLNNYTIQSVYYESKKSHLIEAAQAIEEEQPSSKDLEAYLAKLNRQNKVTAVAIDLNQNETAFNDTLHWKLSAQKVAISKMWFAEARIQNIKDGKYVYTTFDQGKAQTRYLSYAFQYEDKAIILLVSLVNEGELISLFNHYLPMVFAGVFGVALLLMWQLSRKITEPIQALKALAESVSNRSYGSISLKTGDELEELGNQLNQMSRDLEAYHHALNEKNDHLKETIQSLSHEMKTPLALIHAYAAGIRDGIGPQDGPEQVIKQVEGMSHMIDHLLNLAKYEGDVYHYEWVDLVELTQTIINTYSGHFNEVIIALDMEDTQSAQSLNILQSSKQSPPLMIKADAEKLRVVIQNLVSNAVKYTTEPSVTVQIIKNPKTDHIEWTIKNACAPMLPSDFDRLEEPFFVVDQSRNIHTSGTGIGLSLVATILKKHGFDYERVMEDNQFVFRVKLEVKENGIKSNEGSLPS